MASGGVWDGKDITVLNPEGQDAEDAKDRVSFIAAKVRTLLHASLCGNRLRLILYLR